MSQDVLKRQAAQKAIDLVASCDAQTISLGVGTGSTVNHFIDLIDSLIGRLDIVVSSSKASSELLRNKGVNVVDVNTAISLDFYVDGADEINERGEMIKGGGGAQTGEKILACLAECFICIADDSKKVDVLGSFPVAVEVLGDARSYVSREIVKKWQAQPELRADFVTDRGNQILDIFNLDLNRPCFVEDGLNCITGVVENGIFCHQKADIALLAGANGVQQLEFSHAG